MSLGVSAFNLFSRWVKLSLSPSLFLSPSFSLSLSHLLITG